MTTSPTAAELSELIERDMPKAQQDRETERIMADPMAEMRKPTNEEIALAQRIWAAPTAIQLSDEDKDHGLALGLIIWPHASNLCNDVRYGRGYIASR